MAWTTTDVETIEAAIVSGQSRVKFADGREVEYRSIPDLLKARDAIKMAVSGAAGGTMATYGKFIAK
jgi:hypothetical protein